MTCRNCGKEIANGSVFCPHCGATQASTPESPQSTTPAWEGPEGGGKKKTGLIIGVAVAAVAVAAVLVAVLSGVFASPKGRVELAFAKSVAAYVQAYKKLDLPDTAQWQKDQEVTQNMALELKSVNSDLIGYDLSALSGLKLGLKSSFNGPDRLLSADLSAGWGEDDLLDLSVWADNDTLCLNSPQLTGETNYGVNTETLGADLTKLTGDGSMESLSFNVFDLVDLAQEKMDQEKLEKDMMAAAKALWDQAQVKKVGSKSLSINGTDTKAAAYQVTIPEAALNQYVDDLETILSAAGGYDLYSELFQAMGMPQEAAQASLNELEGINPYGELADGLRDIIAEIGDLTLNIYLSGGYVSGVDYAGEIDGRKVDAALRSGGGTEYVDDLGLELMVDDLKFRIDSTGDHSVRGNLFADTTTIQFNDKDSYLVKVTSDLTLDPSKQSDNFQWRLEAESSGLLFALDMAGGMDWDRDYLSLDLDEVSVRAMGVEVCTLSFSYQTENHDAGMVTFDPPKIITQMDQMELITTALDIQGKAETWTGEMRDLFITRLGDLYWLLKGNGVYY